MMSDFGCGEDDDNIHLLVGGDRDHDHDHDHDMGRSDHPLNFLIPDDDDYNNNNNSSSLLPHASSAAASQYDHDLSTIDQIEQFLLFDDSQPQHEDDDHLNSAALDFLSDILLDSPLPPHPSSSSSSSVSPSPSSFTDNPSPDIDLSSSSDHCSDAPHLTMDAQHSPSVLPISPPPPAALSHPHQEQMENDKDKAAEDPQQKQEQELNSNCDDDDGDPLSKKRKRQLRNRDAAVRSRERKKMYVKDLEMKSRFYEAECRRLGMLLQCYLAENHALRLSLHNRPTTTIQAAFDASSTKQESAVLFLESLLLGSLLWFLGIVAALFTLLRRFWSSPEAAGVKKVGSKILGSLAPREAGSNVWGRLGSQAFMMSKRCRGSRRKMRWSESKNVCFGLVLSMTSSYQFLAFPVKSE